MLKSIGNRLEYGLALAGGLASLLATLAVWGPIAANQPLWPLPGVYLIEIPAISLTGMLALWARPLTWVTWAAAGALESTMNGWKKPASPIRIGRRPTRGYTRPVEPWD